MDGASFPFRGAVVVQQTERCLNARHRAAGCNRCVTLCPVAALTLVDGKPVLDEEQCVKCGLCLHGCPTEVFTQANAAESQLIRTVEQLPRQPVALVCALHPTPQHTTTPVTTTVQHRRCLAALSLAQLLALSEDGERAVWLDDTPCRDCPIGQAQSHLQQTTATANTLLQAFARSRTLFLQSSQADQPTTAASIPVSSMAPTRPCHAAVSLLCWGAPSTPKATQPRLPLRRQPTTSRYPFMPAYPSRSRRNGQRYKHAYNSGRRANKPQST